MDLREFLRRQAEQKRQAELQEKINENEEEARKVIGYLKTNADRDSKQRASSKELKERKLQERLQEIRQLHL